MCKMINLTILSLYELFNNYFQLLCMIGEAFDEYSDDICGAVVQIRSKGDKLGVWTADVKHQDAIMKIG